MGTEIEMLIEYSFTPILAGFFILSLFISIWFSIRFYKEYEKN